MFYLVGLGNQGDAYKNTRHNIGFMVLEYFVSEHQLPEFVESAQSSGKVTTGEIDNIAFKALLPSTYMNHSGSAVLKMVSPKEADHLIVVADDIALPFGTIRISFGRGSGGHNGITSIIEKLGTKNFIRVRVGIAPLSKSKLPSWLPLMSRRPLSGANLPKFVLDKFNPKETKALPGICKLGSDALLAIMKHGVDKAMNEFN